MARAMPALVGKRRSCVKKWLPQTARDGEPSWLLLRGCLTHQSLAVPTRRCLVVACADTASLVPFQVSHNAHKLLHPDQVSHAANKLLHPDQVP